MKYLDQFMLKRCASDILNIVAPLHQAAKEISEAMAMREAMKDLFLNHKMEMTLYDMCSGNALVPLIAVFTLPVLYATASDVKVRERRWELAQRFSYVERNVFDPGPTGDVVTGCHACGALARAIIQRYLESAQHLYLMPCCVGDVQVPGLFSGKISRYEWWAHELAEMAGGKAKRDTDILSPCNVIVEAHK